MGMHLPGILKSHRACTGEHVNMIAKTEAIQNESTTKPTTYKTLRKFLPGKIRRYEAMIAHFVKVIAEE
jgi:hypothetical protein